MRVGIGALTLGIVMSSMRGIGTGSPVMAGVQRLRNAWRTSAIGSAHCGSRVCASFVSISCFKAGLRGIACRIRQDATGILRLSGLAGQELPVLTSPCLSDKLGIVFNH